MLQYVNINSLFGLYSYDLDFLDTEDFPVKFITGTNGYGKTTILALINALYSWDFKRFSDIPFKSIEYGFEDRKITIRKLSQSSGNDEQQDDETQENIKLEISVQSGTSKEKSFLVHTGGGGGIDYNGDDERNTQMYLRSLSCYYIKDQRLYHKNASVLNLDQDSQSEMATVQNNAEDLTQKLKKVSNSINAELQASLTNLSLKEDIGGADYNRRKDEIVKKINRLKRYGIVSTDLSVYEYDEKMSKFLNSYINAQETAFEKVADLIDKLDAFYDIICSYDFADKDIMISPQYGYRFRLRNEEKTLLFPSELSSGEQHILILVYELIFKVQDNSLVLIDEPELSSHLMWQLEFLKTIRKILAVRKNKLQGIIATHSPQIFGSRWDLSIDLYDQVKEKK